MSELADIRERVTRYSGVVMIEFENWHRLEDLLDELQAKLTRQEAVVEAAWNVYWNPHDDEYTLKLMEALDQLGDSDEAYC